MYFLIDKHDDIVEFRGSIVLPEDMAAVDLDEYDRKLLPSFNDTTLPSDYLLALEMLFRKSGR